MAERRLLAALAYRRVHLATSANVAADLVNRALAGGWLLADGLDSPLLFAAGIALGLAGCSDEAERLFGQIAARAKQASSAAVVCAAFGQGSRALPPRGVGAGAGGSGERGELGPWGAVGDVRR